MSNPDGAPADGVPAAGGIPAPTEPGFSDHEEQGDRFDGPVTVEPLGSDVTEGVAQAAHSSPAEQPTSDDAVSYPTANEAMDAESSEEMTQIPNADSTKASSGLAPAEQQLPAAGVAAMQAEPVAGSVPEAELGDESWKDGGACGEGDDVSENAQRKATDEGREPSAAEQQPPAAGVAAMQAEPVAVSVSEADPGDESWQADGSCGEGEGGSKTSPRKATGERLQPPPAEQHQREGLRSDTFIMDDKGGTETSFQSITTEEGVIDLAYSGYAVDFSKTPALPADLLAVEDPNEAAVGTEEVAKPKVATTAAEVAPQAGDAAAEKRPAPEGMDSPEAKKNKVEEPGPDHEERLQLRDQLRDASRQVYMSTSGNVKQILSQLATAKLGQTVLLGTRPPEDFSPGLPPWLPLWSKSLWGYAVTCALRTLTRASFVSSAYMLVHVALTSQLAGAGKRVLRGWDACQQSWTRCIRWSLYPPTSRCSRGRAKGRANPTHPLSSLVGSAWRHPMAHASLLQGFSFVISFPWTSPCRKELVLGL